ncbi:MAG TPA: DUF4264 family protein [Firmicutes bacterium]|nr:DUF4264 family protein [Bacillota bacterium]
MLSPACRRQEVARVKAEEKAPGSGGEHEAGERPAEPRIEILGRTTVALSGDTHRLVTFLNQTLKDQSLIFGLTRAANGAVTFTVYRVEDGKSSAGRLEEEQR